MAHLLLVHVLVNFWCIFGALLVQVFIQTTCIETCSGFLVQRQNIGDMMWKLLQKLLYHRFLWGMAFCSIFVSKCTNGLILVGMSAFSLRQLAGIGTSGMHPNHMHRDMLRSLGKAAQLENIGRPCPKNENFNGKLFAKYLTPISVFVGLHCSQHLRILKPTDLSTLGSPWRVSMVSRKHPTGLFGYRMAPTTSIWPHELFAALFMYHRSAFDKYILGGDVGSVRAFWDKMPPRQGMQHKFRWKERVVPLALHGDGVSIANIRGKGAKTMDTLSWTSLLSTASSRLSVFLIWMCYSHLEKKSGMAPTWKTFWKRLTKSLVALYEGVWPEFGMNGARDPRAGQPLAGGFCGMLYVVRGDLEWMSKHFALNHPSSRFPCSLCACSNTGEEDEQHPWTDVNDPPSWMPTIRTDEAGICWLGP